MKPISRVSMNDGINKHYLQEQEKIPYVGYLKPHAISLHNVRSESKKKGPRSNWPLVKNLHFSIYSHETW